MNRISALGLCSLGSLLATVSCRDFGDSGFVPFPGGDSAGAAGSLAGNAGTIGTVVFTGQRLARHPW